MFKSAMNDTSLVPVRCCLPIDQNYGTAVLNKKDAVRYALILEEAEATNKMYW
jgi:hypothetical protein